MEYERQWERPEKVEQAPAAEVQAAMAAAIHGYAQLVEAGEDVPPFAPHHGVTQTEVVLLASRLLAAADLELFELAMWNISGAGEPAIDAKGDTG